MTTKIKNYSFAKVLKITLAKRKISIEKSDKKVLY